MRGTPSRRTTSASLPIARRIWRQARAEPIASPSGRACEVSTKRLRCSMCLRTSFNIKNRRRPSVFSPQPLHALCRRLLGRLTTEDLLFSLLCAAQQFINSCAVLVRAVEMKIQLRRAAKMQIFRDFAPDESNCRGQAFKRTVGLGVISIERDVNLCRARIFCQHNAGDADQSNTRIAQFALHDGFDLFPQGLPQALPMVFRAALLHTHLLSKTNENIRKLLIAGLG